METRTNIFSLEKNFPLSKKTTHLNRYTARFYSLFQPANSTQFPEIKNIMDGNLYDFTPLIAAINANDTLLALEKFRKDVAQKNINNSYFLIQTMRDAVNVYIENYDSWTGSQCQLFWQKIIGYLQRLLPPTHELLQGNSLPIHNLNPHIKLHDNLDNHPLDRDPHFRLGFEFAILQGVPLTWCSVSILQDSDLPKKLDYLCKTIQKDVALLVERLTNSPLEVELAGKKL